MSVRVRVLFVCLGNICRSPVAEGVLKHRLRAHGLEHVVEVTSAGLGNWHVGERPDQRSRAVAERNGVPLDSRARLIDTGEFELTDWIICMDHQNRRALAEIGAPKERVRLLKSFAPTAIGASDEIDDPYQHGSDAFDRMFLEIAQSVEHLIDRLVEAHGLERRARDTPGPGPAAKRSKRSHGDGD